MSICRSRSFLALLLGAGVSGGLPASAQAGDKIEFSRASETLALPTVDRPKSEAADDSSDFAFRNSAPPAQIIYPVMSLPTEAPARRAGERNARNGNGDLGSDLARFGLNDSFENPVWGTYATDYSSKPASNYFNAMKASGTSENPDGLGRGLDRLDSRYGQGDARLESLTPAERRDRQNDLGFGNAGNRSLGSRTNDANGPGGGTSLADLLQKQNKPLLENRPGLFKSLSPFSGSKASGDSMFSSLMPSASPLISPLDGMATGYNGYKEQAGRTPSLTPGKIPDKADEGLSRGLPGLSVWGDTPGFNLQASQPAQRKPLSPASPGGAQRQQPKVILDFPKKPGSIIN